MGHSRLSNVFGTLKLILAILCLGTIGFIAYLVHVLITLFSIAVNYVLYKITGKRGYRHNMLMHMKLIR